MKRVAVLAGTVGLCLLLGQPTPALATEGAGEWMPPLCGQVVGDGSVTFTWNDGHSLTRTSQPMSTGTMVSDVDVLASANRVITVTYDGRVSTSEDAGCTWTEIGRLDAYGPFAISPAPDGSAYLWTRYNDVRLYHVEGTAIVEVTPTLTYAFMALAVDPVDARHVRVVDATGAVLDSTDGGQSFRTTGAAPVSPGGGTVGLYDAAIAPTDLDRVVLGTVVDGAFSSGDGGRTWTRSAMAAPGHRVNVFTVTVSPVDPSVVWAMGLDITEHDSGASNEGRHIFRSIDGGQTFRSVVDHVPGQVTLTNGLPLVPHPVDAARVYFEFGTWFAGYGTDLFAYDARLDQLTSTHNPYDDITAMAFNPRFPTVAYLGLAEVR